MPIAHVNGQKLYYEDTGGNGHVLVFSHGFLLDSDMFIAQVAALRQRYRCISWDQRGFGRTGTIDEEFTYWDSARDALALMDHLGVEQAVLIGLSQGGFLSMRAALLAPERVKALVLISTRSGIDTAETIENFTHLKSEWLANGSTNIREPVAGMLLGNGTEHESWFRKWNAMDRSALSHPIDALAGRDDLTNRLGDINCPVLVIHGDADTAIDVAHGRALAADFAPKASLEIISGAGHAPTLSHFENVTVAISKFLSSQG